MLVIFAMALLLSMPKSDFVVAFMPYWSFLRSLQSSIVMSLRMSIFTAKIQFQYIVPFHGKEIVLLTIEKMSQ
jgi:hypothetical protein